MKPSANAMAIQEAHDLFKRAMGTPNEQSAMAYLEAVVRRVKAGR